jgi:low temperature requirement protein LtrA
MKVAVQQAEDGSLALGVRSQEIITLRREMLESEQRRNRTLIGTALGFGSLLWIGFGLPPGIVGWLLLIVAAVVLWSARRR